MLPQQHCNLYTMFTLTKKKSHKIIVEQINYIFQILSTNYIPLLIPCHWNSFNIKLCCLSSVGNLSNSMKQD